MSQSFSSGDTPAAASPTPRPRFRMKIALTCCAVVGAGLVTWQLIGRTNPEPQKDQVTPATASPSPDPRLAYQGPFKNVHPDVAYVSDTLCVDCHAKEAKSYSHHPMARTLMPITQVGTLAVNSESHNPFDLVGQRFQVVSENGKVRHVRSAMDDAGRTLFQQEVDVNLAVGSGTHAQSYLSVHGSTILQSPITWFAEKKIWDLSPGFNPGIFVGRRIGGDCLFCHSNGAHDHPTNDLTVLEPAFPNGHGIGCQRCHGPGGEHVKNPGHTIKTATGNMDPTIVNPVHLSASLRESICWQCHLEGAVRIERRGRHRYDFRPGMPLEDFIDVFEDPSEATYEGVVNHARQMFLSKCYVKSAEPKKLGCVSCHDPHEKPSPEKKHEHFQAACMKCHQDIPCSLPQNQRLAQDKSDSCVHCHMPAVDVADIDHVAATDHRISRKPIKRKSDKASQERPLRDLVSVFQQHRIKDNPEDARDRALAGSMLEGQGRQLLHPLNDELEQAAKRDPTDMPIQVKYALLLLQQNKSTEAQKVIDGLLSRQPDHEMALYCRAIAFSEQNRSMESVAAWRELVKMAPASRGYRINLITELAKSGKAQEVADEAELWLAIDPGSVDARTSLRDSLLRLGKAVEAKAQHQIILQLTRKKP